MGAQPEMVYIRNASMTRAVYVGQEFDDCRVAALIDASGRQVEDVSRATSVHFAFDDGRSHYEPIVRLKPMTIALDEKGVGLERDGSFPAEPPTDARLGLIVAQLDVFLKRTLTAAQMATFDQLLDQIPGGEPK